MRSLIALDVDSVLVPINEIKVLPELRRHWPNLTMPDISAFSYKECLGAEVQEVAYSVFRRPDLYDDVVLTPEATDALALLRSVHDRVIAVTSPFAEHASSKWRMLQRIGFAHGDIVLCGDKGLIDFDVLVDDRAETCEELGNDRCIVFDRPWNRFADLSFHRAYGWPDVPRKVARLLKEAENVARHSAGRMANRGTCVHGTDMRKTCDDCGRVHPNDL